MLTYAQNPKVFLRLDGRVVQYTGALEQARDCLVMSMRRICPYIGTNHEAALQVYILKFLAKNVKAVKAGWDELVKPKLKQVLC